jgi:hypothetical protein
MASPPNPEQPAPAKRATAKRTRAPRAAAASPRGTTRTGNADPRAPLDSAAFLAEAVKVVRLLEKDLLHRAGDPHVRPSLETVHAHEAEVGLTGEAFEVWLRAFVTQVAVAWVLSAVFARTLEDRGLLARPRLAGPGALDAQRVFFELAPALNERDYLRLALRELAHYPATERLFDTHNPIHRLAPSAEGAKAILELFRTPDPAAPTFRFGGADTRFLGDLYQDLSEAVRERYALLQTPIFVEEYILGRTLGRALERFGVAGATVLDPTCGSGHFLLGAFDRLFDAHTRAAPSDTPQAHAQRALDQIAGTDINPYAVAIARFRLTLAFLEKTGHGSLRGAPAPRLHLAVVDSLLLNPRRPQGDIGLAKDQAADTWFQGLAFQEVEEGKKILGRGYTAVVGNPPYITVKDALLRDEYRRLYPKSAAGKYSLAAPFLECFFQLAAPKGFIGTITANSFMKREFGKKLIEDYLPSVNLDGVLNTSGAYIPGHGTPTVLLFGSHEPAQAPTVHTVLAKRGEPSTPDDPAQGKVWRSLVDHGAQVGYDDDYLTVAEIPRETLKKHPWSLGGGGAAELKELLEQRAEKRLGEVAESVGISCFTLEDDVFLRDGPTWRRLGAPPERLRPMVIGEAIRDWTLGDSPVAFFPYTPTFEPLPQHERDLRLLWPWRTNLANNKLFGGVTKVEGGLGWHEYGRLTVDKLRTPLSITFAFVATHNHFVLDRGGKVFNRSAPIIKLPPDATEDDHLALLAYLNSSTACFWMKQVCMNKGGSGIGRGIQDEAWESRFEFDGTKLGAIPLPPRLSTLASLARDILTTLESEGVGPRACALQERLDLAVYRLFGLLSPEARWPLPEALPPGHRPFEVELLRGDRPSAWHSRNGYARPPADAAGLTELDLPPEVLLIEQPEYKRRWTLPVDTSAADTRARLLDLIETRFDGAILPASALRGDLTPADLLAESVPFLAAYRYSPSGLEKHAQWQHTWALQRLEDAGQLPAGHPPIPVPPKYDQRDYRDATTWRLRGKLDVPKERFIRYPGCELDPADPVFGWAGWNHLQRAQALAALYEQRRSQHAWDTPRLLPLLAGLAELLPWLHQWHAAHDPSLGDSPARGFDEYLRAALRDHGLTLEGVEGWRP